MYRHLCRYSEGACSTKSGTAWGSNEGGRCSSRQDYAGFGLSQGSGTFANRSKVSRLPVSCCDDRKLINYCRCTLRAERASELGWKAGYSPEHILEAAGAEMELVLKHLKDQIRIYQASFARTKEYSDLGRHFGLEPLL